MEHVKRYAGRAAALALACFVVAFSVVFPASAAESSSLSGIYHFVSTMRYTDGTYSTVSYSKEYPVLNNVGNPYLTLTLGKTIDRVGGTVEFADLPIGNRVRLHAVFSGNLTYGNSVSRYQFNVAASYGGPYSSIAYDIVSSSNFYDSNTETWSYEVVADFTVPLGSTAIKVYGYAFPANNIVVTANEQHSMWNNVRVVEFLTFDPVVDQTDEDKNESDRVDGAVSDKTQQSNQITNQIEQLQKPNVDSSSGMPVVGGMVVDPMQQVDRDSFNAYTNVLGTIFGSSTILGYFIIVFSLIFISYVIFGKSGG